MNTVRHYLISGRVQGVWYRGSCQQQALKLGLKGWVRNLPDGRVEAVASGSESSLEEFEHWLQQGPPMARVTDVDIRPDEEQVWQSFELIDV